MSKIEEVSGQPEARIIIVCRQNSPKLTARGKGEFEYELGVNSVTEEQFIRISGNPKGGSFSKEYVSILKIEAMLDNRGKDEHSFKSAFFVKAFTGRSANNPGLLAAALLKEGSLIRPLPDQPTLLTSASFDGIKTKISELFAEGVDLTDNVAKELEQREQEKAKRKAEKKATKDKAAASNVQKPEVVQDRVPKVTKKDISKDKKSTPKKKKAAKKADTKSGQ